MKIELTEHQINSLPKSFLSKLSKFQIVDKEIKTTKTNATLLQKIKVIKEAVELSHNMKFDFANRKIRKREIVEFRQHMFFLLNQYTSLKLKGISDQFGQDFNHATIIHGCQTWQDLLDTTLEKRTMHKIATDYIEQQFTLLKKEFVPTPVCDVCKQFMSTKKVHVCKMQKSSSDSLIQSNDN